MVGGISLVNRRSRLGDDTGIGLLFVGMLALGVIIISKSRSFTTDVQSLLFGDVLGRHLGRRAGAGGRRRARARLQRAGLPGVPRAVVQRGEGGQPRPASRRPPTSRCWP